MSPLECTACRGTGMRMQYRQGDMITDAMITDAMSPHNVTSGTLVRVMYASTLYVTCECCRTIVGPSDPAEERSVPYVPWPPLPWPPLLP